MIYKDEKMVKVNKYMNNHNISQPMLQKASNSPLLTASGTQGAFYDSQHGPVKQEAKGEDFKDILKEMDPQNLRLYG